MGLGCQLETGDRVSRRDSPLPRAKRHGAVYTTRLALSKQDGLTRPTMTFGSAAQTLGAKLMAAAIPFNTINGTGIPFSTIRPKGASSPTRRSQV